MPKQKTHSGAAKRFSLKKSGKIKRAQQGKYHILTKKTTTRTRNLRGAAYVDSTQEKTISRMLSH